MDRARIQVLWLMGSRCVVACRLWNPISLLPCRSSTTLPYGALAAVDIPASTIAACPLFGNVFEALAAHPGLFAVACDVVADLLNAYKE